VNDLIESIIVGRTDAGLGLLMSILISKGIVSGAEMIEILDRATASVSTAPNGAAAATVFAALRLLIDDPVSSEDDQAYKRALRRGLQ
jgi:hypothetical protein